ncbi:hydroxylamine reductase [Dethiosulfatarculus sandiegensis]|uniref:Hydroxylamine reductase n=1 Tax=Dethiosulfatarculus sandiegensis TaxID=1429043 RepID=A0A0D2J8X8_9BACT|nr:hydroxylamine reductase [Dethiosulfatarculus sandiegensis]KIX12186.1 2-keto-3-deoxygluconate permease [Dethiosulfatarculus sandiegensis]
MFCYQCEQTARGQGCTVKGVCGKEPSTAALQDLLTYAVQGLGIVAHEARQKGVNNNQANRFTSEALFSTLTNVDFDDSRFVPLIKKAVELREAIREKAGLAPAADGPAAFTPADDLEGLVAQGEAHGLKQQDVDPDVESLRHLILFGLRGVAAYADHAAILGQEDDQVYAFVHEALASMWDKSLGVNDYVGLALKAGEINLRTMELLDAGNTGVYGHPAPTEVPLGHKAGKAILVSGHDLKDLAQLLEQTRDKGIYIYTHGEMLPTHGYPELKKYEHFYGHYGTAWQNQGKEFPLFPGAILMTTNCIQRPKGDTPDKIFTTGLVGWPGVPHIAEENGKKDFTKVIEKALALPGFQEDENKDSVMVGFARNAVMGVADKVIEAVKAGAIKHFFLVGGCDGAKPGRDYYTEFVEKTPSDTVILTLACGKFRFFDKKLGDIGGIPRLLDVGQCNDAYSAIQIAVALSKAFDCGVNDLPLSMILSWYEQKACAILLTLLYLGIKDIRLGPSLPAFVSPNVLKVLVENFNIMPITTPDKDLEAILG